LKIKVEQVERPAPTSKVVLQKSILKIKVKHVEEQVDLQKPNPKIRIDYGEKQIDLEKPNLNIKVKKHSKTYIID
jgi:hypothetical protein